MRPLKAATASKPDVEPRIFVVFVMAFPLRKMCAALAANFATDTRVAHASHQDGTIWNNCFIWENTKELTDFIIQASVQATSFPIPIISEPIPAASSAPSERKKGYINNRHITVPLPAH
jgi:hypothetical protein